MGPALWHWFVFLIPPSSPHFFISHAASLVRLPIDTSQSLSWGGGLRQGGSGGIFGETAARKGRWNNNLTANDGMPGSRPQCAGLHTDQQLPESMCIITNIYPSCWPTIISLNNSTKRCSCCSSMQASFWISLSTTITATATKNLICFSLGRIRDSWEEK